MFGGIGFGAERLGFVAVKFPKIATACLIALLILIGFSIPRVSFDEDIHRVFFSQSPLSQAQIAYTQEKSAPLSTILIHITSPTPLNGSDLTTLRDLSLDLEFIDGVTAVASPFVLRWPPTHDAPNGTPVFGQDITDAYVTNLSNFEALDTGLPTFLNTTRTAMLLSVSIDIDQTTVPKAVETISSEITRALPSNLTANLTGEDAISAEIVAGLKTDLITLNIWGSLIVTLAAFALLRDLRMALVSVIPALFGAAGALALTVWLGYPVTVLSNVIPILLLVLGVANGVHLAGHLKEHSSVYDAIETVGPACALTAFTTAVAFASIALTGNEQLFEFAILGALGTVLAFVIVIITFALLGHAIAFSKQPIPQLSTTFAQKLTKVGTKHPGTTTTICIALLAIATFGFTQTKAWFPLYQNLPDTSETRATNDAIASDFGGVFQMIIGTDSYWETTRTLIETLEQQSGPHTVLSELNFARWLGHPDRRPTQDELEILPKPLDDQLRSTNDAARIFISVPEPMRSDTALNNFDALYDTAVKKGANSIIGLPTIMRQEAVSLIDQLSLSLVLAALGATLLVAFAFRSAKLLPILFIPNLLPLMITGASLHLWAQGQLNPTAVLALTIAFGIAIDDTVHFLNRFTAAKTQGYSRKQAVNIASKSAGQAMVLTTLLLSVGLSVTLTSDFFPIRLFGGMMIVTLWAALLIDLLLLPALLTWKEPPHDKTA